MQAKSSLGAASELLRDEPVATLMRQAARKRAFFTAASIRALGAAAENQSTSYSWCSVQRCLRTSFAFDSSNALN